MCCDSPDYPQVDPRQIDALLKQTDIADRIANYTIEAGKRNETRLATNDAQSKKITDAYMEDMSTSRDRSTQMWQEYQSRQGVRDKMYEDAMGWDSEDNLSKARAKAYTDVEQQYGIARDAMERNLARTGINPANGRYQTALAQGGADLALAKVNAANQMVEGRRAQAVGLRSGAATFSNTGFNNSVGLTSQAQGLGQGVVGVGTAGMNSALGVQGATTSGFGAAGGMFGSVANGYGNVFNQQLGSAQAQDANDPMKTILGAAAGVGTAFGIKKFA